MKTIIFLRHAKASAGDSRMRDQDRPLNEQGVEACQRMGGWLKANGKAPDFILCSPSRRTRQTAEWVLPAAGFGSHIQYVDSLYLATAGEIFAQLQRVNDTLSTTMVIGHNPGIHEAALRLLDSGPPALLDLLEIKFPTACVAIYTCPITRWRDIAPHIGTLIHYVSPKMIGLNMLDD
jgi:phosphohistidine phosphatase